MRLPAARGATLWGPAVLVAFAALFFSAGSSQSRLFWIGSAAVVVAAIGWMARPVRIARAGIAFFAALAALVLWQGLSIGWSIQAARSWDYTNRGLVYFAFAAVGALLGGVAPRRLAQGSAALLGALFAWALLAKAFPGLYDDYGRLARLRYPVAYWNELALLAAASVPIGLWLVGRGGDRRARIAGAVLLYGALVVVLLTFSRVGVILSVLAAIVWLALDRRRLLVVGPLAVAWVAGGVVGGIGLLLPGVSDNGQPHDVRVQDGLLFGAAVIVGVAAVVVALRFVLGRAVDRRVARGVAGALVGAGAVVLVVAFVRAGGPLDFVRDRWHEFNNPASAQVANVPGRLASVSSSNRFRWWQEAWNAWVDKPAQGTGAGTFGLTDRLERRTSLAVVEPHSTPLQFLTETGIVGFLLWVAVIATASVAIWRRGGNGATLALALAAAVAVVHSLVDIDWDYIAVEGPLFLVVGALVSAPGTPLPRRGWLWPSVVGIAALAALYSLASPWLSDRKVNAAYDKLVAGDPAAARNDAKAAHALNPLAIEPLIVWALTEDGQKALDLYRRARDREPKNPETWYELGAFELQEGRPRAAYRDLNESYTLDRYGPAGEPGGALDVARCRIDPATCPK
jgi:O-antigen ligase/polysaccharide polymerase Wzy-like membrane protein